MRVNKIQATNACRLPIRADPSLLDSIRYFQGCDTHVKTVARNLPETVDRFQWQ